MRRRARGAWDVCVRVRVRVAAEAAAASGIQHLSSEARTRTCPALRLSTAASDHHHHYHRPSSWYPHPCPASVVNLTPTLTHTTPSVTTRSSANLLALETRRAIP